MFSRGTFLAYFNSTQNFFLFLFTINPQYVLSRREVVSVHPRRYVFPSFTIPKKCLKNISLYWMDLQGKLVVIFPHQFLLLINSTLGPNHIFISDCVQIPFFCCCHLQLYKRYMSSGGMNILPYSEFQQPP